MSTDTHRREFSNHTDLNLCSSVFICGSTSYAEKLEPHPHVLVAFGFLNTNPLPII